MSSPGTLEWNGYVATTWFDTESRVIRARVTNVDDIITFYALNTAQLRKAFEDVMTAHIAFGEQIGVPLQAPKSVEYSA